MRSHEPNTLANSSIHIHQPTKGQAAATRNKNKTAIDDEANRQLLKNTDDHRKGPIDDHDAIVNSKFQSHEVDGNSENSSSVSYTPAICGPKILLKFIDSSVDSDLPPSLSGLKHESKLLSASDRNLSTVSITKSVEFKDNPVSSSRHNLMSDRGGGLTTTVNGKHEVDSAVEESTSSSENNQV